jgi:hypothetical protein
VKHAMRRSDSSPRAAIVGALAASVKMARIDMASRAM